MLILLTLSLRFWWRATVHNVLFVVYLNSYTFDLNAVDWRTRGVCKALKRMRSGAEMSSELTSKLNQRSGGGGEEEAKREREGERGKCGGG